MFASPSAPKNKCKFCVKKTLILKIMLIFAATKVWKGLYLFVKRNK